MYNKIWKNRWKTNDIGFHEPLSNPLLSRFLPSLNLSKNDPILVPLCGKSLDMDVLADLGFNVIGVELSNLAIKAYFEAREVKPKREKQGRFIRWSHDNIEILCGDIFDLTHQHIGHINALYDCTSLAAFPSELRPAYVRHFFERLSKLSQILLITSESSDDSISHSELTIDSEVNELYRHCYQVELLHGLNCLKRDPEHPESPMQLMDEKVYHMKSHSYIAHHWPVKPLSSSGK